MKNIKINKFMLSIVIGAMPLLLTAQEPVKEASNSVLNWTYQNIFIVLSAILIIGVMTLMLKLLNVLVDFHKVELLREQGIEITPESLSKKDSFFKTMYDKATGLIPMDKEADIDLGHDYDGIRELDNRLPPWWLYLFYVTILIAVGYIYVYHLSDIGNSQQEEYIAAMETAKERQAMYLATQANSVDENTVVALMDEKALSDGQSIYIGNCAACHGNEGQGGVGPNLTDDYWIHGGHITDVFKTIKYGVPEKGMISWKSQLKPSAMQKVSSYIMTLKGTNPPNPKDPQGEKYIEETKDDQSLSLATTK